VTIVSGNLQGEVAVTEADSEVASPDIETWTLDLSPWANYYHLPATQGALTGRYKEELADFAQNGDTIVTVGYYGNISFQSASSGCTGLGGHKMRFHRKSSERNR
jgi:hypothetical protein